MHEHDWVSAHIFYHDHLDPVLRRFVAPLVDDLAAAGVSHRYFFLRYWDGGNHLRLRLSANPRYHDQIRRRLIDRSSVFFQERPAADSVTHEEYMANAAQLARYERVTDYAKYLYPNNSLAFIPYQREYSRYGNSESIAAVEQHFAESSQIALRLITNGISSGVRNTAAFSIVALTWLCMPHRTSLGLSMPIPDNDPVVDEQYVGQATALVRLAEQLHVMASWGRNAAGDGTLAAWIRSVHRLRDTLGDSATTATVLDTCAHLACNRLGVLGAGETYLRGLAIRTLAEWERRGHAMA